MKRKYFAFKIGIIFTVVSLLLSLTYVVPIFSVLPATPVEILASGLVDKNPYSNVGKLTIHLLLTVLLLFIFIVFKIIKSKAKINSDKSGFEILFIMSIFYFIVHPLGFYFYWGVFLNFESDGQLIFSAVDSFPYSSLSFMILGLFIDKIWERNLIQ
ncbi:hypothetical protein [Chryseobacterium sp. Leaf394]|uniref:hypothetical protein n=1 Tax=Chryseobacterium sp. Leaf394 TaxID=1736361 RepID=UPI0006FA3978|nr:hypothetical protein [Chryseobacterium sp. Leaf394]KQS91473.1 hypothetical protein ASG21_03090 [Chryseobacterium sp. Leaf394]